MSYPLAQTPATLVLSPAKGAAESGTAAEHLAWAIYHFEGLEADRPQRIRADAAAAGQQPDTPDVHLEYYLGMADFTRHSWSWYGPFAGDAEVVLNGLVDGAAQQRRQRLVDGSGNAYCCILVDSRRAQASTANPLGYAAVALNRLNLIAGDVVPTAPLFPQALQPRIGASARQGSALEPSQFAVLEWLNFDEPLAKHVASNTTSVSLYRRGPADAAPLLLGTVAPLAGQFIDPLDSSSSAVAGTTYSYYMQHRNSGGATPLAEAGVLTVPILAPPQLTATVNSTEVDGTALAWVAVDGAWSYQILRGQIADGSDGEVVATVAAPALQHIDTSGWPGQPYYYWVRALGIGDGNAANGPEQGAISPLSGAASGLRPVYLAIAGPVGSSGAGSPADPYHLTGSGPHQFTVVDQAAHGLTGLCTYAVDPPHVASVAAGQVTVNQAGTEFDLLATFGYGGHVWQAKVRCKGL